MTEQYAWYDLVQVYAFCFPRVKKGTKDPVVKWELKALQ